MELNLGFMASGNGSNVEAILNNIKKGRLNAEAKFVMSNNPDARVLEIAKDREVPSYCLNSGNTKCLDHEILELFKRNDITLGVLAGYNKKISNLLLEYCPFTNIHPAIDLEKYGGKGMYGENVHKAVIEGGEIFSGATVHLVTLEYDKGRILGQRTVLIHSDDHKLLAERVLKVEHKLYACVLSLIQKDYIKLE